jgi:3-oxoacyl-[acyl-carrier protein] reductase
MGEGLKLMEYEGKTLMVTGAGSGIGKTIAKMFALEGAFVIACDINPVKVKETVDEIINEKGKAVSMDFDVSEEYQVKNAVARILEEYGAIDILINSAGIIFLGKIEDISAKQWDKVLAVNLKGTFNFTRACARHMLKERWGRIINIASVIGEMGNIGQANYAAAKAGIIGFTKSVAKELASRNITVNAVAPGFIKTPMTENLPENVVQEYLKLIPLGREGTADDIASLCLFIASDEASYITGQVIRIDGGMLIA